jgi:hypothetical protein
VTSSRPMSRPEVRQHRTERDGAFLDFRLEAVRFWCEAGPVIRAAQADVLASLG